MNLINKINERLSKRDKISLIVMIVFLAIAGYYFVILEPVTANWKKTGSQLAKKEKELKLRKRKIRESASWTKDKEKIAERILMINSRIKMPPSTVKLPERIKSVMQASQGALLKVEDIRPITSLLDDGETKVVNTFSLEGFTKADNFFRFIENSWGMKVEEVSLSMTKESDRPIRFFTKLSSLKLDDSILSAFKTDNEMNPVPYNLTHDPFYPKKKPVPVVEIVEEPEPEYEPEELEPEEMEPLEPEPVVAKVSFQGLRLVGLTSIGRKRSAILTDTLKNEDVILFINDNFRDYTVTGIDENGLDFTGYEGDVKRVEFPKEEASLNIASVPVIETEKEIPALEEIPPLEEIKKGPPPKKGRLGLGLNVLTPALAAKKNLPMTRGLLITKARAGEDEINAGDVILSINGISITEMRQAQKIMKSVNAGDEVLLGMYRDGELKDVKIKAIE